MSARDRLLSLVLGATAVCTIAAGGVSAADLRADERRERALAAEKREQAREQRELAAYRQQVTPIAIGVYDLVQPLQLSFGDLDDGDVDLVDVVVDVGRHVSGDKGLAPMRARLEAVVPPAPLQDEHAALVTALGDMKAAAARVGGLELDEDAVDFASVIAKADLALDDATRAWIGPIVPVFQGAAAPPVPVTDGIEGRRTPLSRASYLRDAGNLCSAGIGALERAGANKEEPSVQEISAGLRELDGRVSRLLSVKAPTADDGAVASTIRAHLRRTDQLRKGFDAALAAVRRGDEPAVRAGQAQLARGEIAAEKAAAGYRAYGSQICGLYLVGLEEGAAGAGPKDGTRTT